MLSLAAERDQENPSLFDVSVFDGGVKCSLLADQGADVNLLLPHVFEEMTVACPSISIEKLEPPISSEQRCRSDHL